MYTKNEREEYNSFRLSYLHRSDFHGIAYEGCQQMLRCCCNLRVTQSLQRQRHRELIAMPPLAATHRTHSHQPFQVISLCGMT